MTAIYDACFSVVTRKILKEFLCVEIHALIGKTTEDGMLLVVEVSPRSVTSHDFSTIFDVIVVLCLLVAYYQMRKNW